MHRTFSGRIDQELDDIGVHDDHRRHVDVSGAILTWIGEGCRRYAIACSYHVYTGVQFRESRFGLAE